MKTIVVFTLACAAAFTFISSCSLVNSQAEPVPSSESATQDSERLDTVIASRSDTDKQRDVYRNPKETLIFFGIEPGMTVVEVLPGGGWYSRILAPYLREDGVLHAVTYADTMWDLFGFMSPEFIAKRKAQMQNWSNHVDSYGGNGHGAKGFAFDAVPNDLEGQVDAVLMIRALHNLNRFEARAGIRTNALSDVYRMLKPGGIVGVVQHRAPSSMPDDWSTGKNGYLKRRAVIEMFESQGFKLVDASEVNSNSKDIPTVDDSVWRLPPSLRGVKNNPDKLEQSMTIGESDRMTLKFVKPM